MLRVCSYCEQRLASCRRYRVIVVLPCCQPRSDQVFCSTWTSNGPCVNRAWSLDLPFLLLKGWGNMSTSWGPGHSLLFSIFFPSSPQLKLSLAGVQKPIVCVTLGDTGYPLPVLVKEGRRPLKVFRLMQQQLSMEGAHGIIKEQKASLDKSPEFIQERQVFLEGGLVHMRDLEPHQVGSYDLVREQREAREGEQSHPMQESHGSLERRLGLKEDQQGLRSSPKPMLAQECVTAVVRGTEPQHLEGTLFGATGPMGELSQTCKSAHVGPFRSLAEPADSLLEKSRSEPLENMEEEYRPFGTLEVCMEETQTQIPGSHIHMEKQDSAVVLAHVKRRVNDVPNVESTEPLKELQRYPVEEPGSIQNPNRTIGSDRPVDKLEMILKNPSFDQEEGCTGGSPFPMKVVPMSLEWQVGSNWSTENSPSPAVTLPELDSQEAASTEAEILFLEPSASSVLQDTDASEELENAMDEKKRKKKKRCRPRKKKKKSEAPVSADISWLAELPFAKTEIGTIFEIPSKSSKAAKQKRKQKDKNKSKDDFKEKLARPNYFISLPITNPKIVQDIEMIQDTLVKKECRLAKAMIPHGILHITLFVMHLASEDDIARVTEALAESKDAIEEILQGKRLVLPFEGVADFRNEVIFAKLTGEEESTESKLILVKETLEKIFKEKSIPVKDNKAFTPHLTIMKLSRSPKIRKQGLKKIDVHLYENFTTHYFGEDTLTGLDFCSMVKKRQPNGYYHCESSITFEPILEEIPGANQVPYTKSGDSEDMSNLPPLPEQDLEMLAACSSSAVPSKSAVFGATPTTSSHHTRKKPARNLTAKALGVKLNQIKELLAKPEIRAKMYKELCAPGARSRHDENQSHRPSTL